MRISNQQMSSIQKIFNKKNQAEIFESTSVKSKKDGFNISSEARLFSVALKAAQALPARDDKELENLKMQIKEDSYEVSNEDIAERFLNDSLF
jgi:anti-sigma28 factor (negative regulator of flagellin synthesis)